MGCVVTTPGGGVPVGRPAQGATSLDTVLRARIDALAPTTRSALQVLVCGAPLTQRGAIERLGLGPLIELEQAQLAEMVTLHDVPSVRLADPRYAAAAKAAADPATWQDAARDAAAILDATPGSGHRAVDVLIDAGVTPPAARLLALARHAHTDLDHERVTASLDLLLAEASPSPAERAEAELLLGLSAAGRMDAEAADGHLAAAAALAPTRELFARAVSRRGNTLAARAGRFDVAENVLRDGLDELERRWPDAPGDDPWAAYLREDLRYCRLMGGSDVQDAPPHDPGPQDAATTANRALVDAVVAVMAGRLDETDHHVEIGLAVVGAIEADIPVARDLLLLSRTLARAFAGDQAAAAAIIEAELGRVDGGRADPAGTWMMVDAMQRLVAGRLAGAVTAAAAAAEALAERDFTGLRPLSIAVGALATARLGDPGGAAALVATVEPAWREETKVALLCALVNAWNEPPERSLEAADVATAAAKTAASQGHVVFGMLAAHDAALLHPGHPGALAFLGMARDQVDGPLVQVLHDHAALTAEAGGPVPADDRATLDVLGRLERFGFPTSAVETAGRIAAEARAAGEQEHADRWLAVARTIWSRHPGLAMPRAAIHPDGPDLLLLTDPERELVSLAARGWGLQEIADELGLPPTELDELVTRATRALGRSPLDRSGPDPR